MTRYSVHSFQAGGSAGSSFDLSAFFNTPGIADPHQPNTTWQLTETEADAPQSGWNGDVGADGSLEPGPGTPGNLIFIDNFSCVGDMEIQVDSDDSDDCPGSPPPLPGAGAGPPGGVGGGGCGAGGGCSS